MRQNNMKVIGITGGVGSGKSAVLAWMEQEYGACICQMDEVAKQLQKKGTECYDQIVAYFGEDILDEKKELDREKIADIVFTDKAKLEALNAIVHPAVKEEIKKKIRHEERKNTNLFILESALLIEDHYEEVYDELWYVYVKTEVRKNRLFYSRGYKESKIDDIMASQLTKEQFMKECDRVIDNNGVFAETMIQIDQIVKNL